MNDIKTFKSLLWVIPFGGCILMTVFITTDIQHITQYIPVPFPMMKGIKFVETRIKETPIGFIFLTEEEISRGNIINDPLKWANGSFSTCSFTQKRTSHSLGEEIRIYISMYDGYGKRRTHGGDYLRLWMENPKLKAVVSGRVIDYNNGSYTGILKAMWSGSATVGVVIARRREEIAHYYTLFRRYQSLWTAMTDFSNGKSTEVSVCAVSPLNTTSGGREWCNMTMTNYGYPWYCLKPKRSELTCEMWNTSWSTGPQFNTGITRRFYMSNWTKLPELTLNISGTASQMKSPSKLCHKLPPEVTWERKSPNGFFYNNTWRFSHCTDNLPNTPKAYCECLKGKTLWLHGDSTSGQFYDTLHRRLHPPSNKVGHYPSKSYFAKYNFSLSWHAHEFPFYHGGIRYLKSTNQAINVLLDTLPNNSEDIVVMYLYIHFTLNHPDVFRLHVQRLVPSVKRLVERAPKVTLAVRGPHAYYNSRLFLSYWGLIYIDILHKEFAPIQKHVVYLDFWDLTVARPTGVHPSLQVVNCMVHNMMSLLCHRNKGS